MATLVGTIRSADGFVIDGAAANLIAKGILLDVSDSLGRYSLALPAGKHVVRYDLDDVPAVFDTVYLPDGTTVTHDVVLPTPAPAQVTFVVVDTDDRPLADASVTWGIGNASGAWDTDSAGTMFPIAVRPGWIRYAIGKEGYQPVGFDSVCVGSRELRRIRVHLDAMP